MPSRIGLWQRGLSSILIGNDAQELVCFFLVAVGFDDTEIPEDRPAQDSHENDCRQNADDFRQPS